MNELFEIHYSFDAERSIYFAEFHFRFEKELEFAFDDAGNPVPTYAQISVDIEEPYDNRILYDWHMSKAAMTCANIFNQQELGYVVPISRDEYLAANTYLA